MEHHVRRLLSSLERTVLEVAALTIIIVVVLFMRFYDVPMLPPGLHGRGPYDYDDYN